MKYLLILSILGCSLIACNSNKNILSNQWPKTTVKVDGILSEWQLPLQRPAKYLAANDNENLYIAARITNKQLQQRIMGLGMTVWIDTLMKNRERIGIAYPLAVTNEQLESIAYEAQKDGKLDPRALDDGYAKICQEFELVGFVEERVRVSNLASRDMKVAMTFDEVGAMVCEIKLPLSQLWQSSLQYNEKLSLGFKINSPEKDVAEEPGLFDDPNQNSITSSRQNSMGLPGQQPMQPQQRLTGSTNENLGVWLRTTLTKEAS